MTFLLFTNKSSVLKKNSRYVQGGTTVVLPNALGWWDKILIPSGQIDDIQYPITPQYNKRPDAVAYFLYGRTDVTWALLQYNDIVDINEEFVTGVKIMAPSPMRLFSDILTNPISYHQQL